MLRTATVIAVMALFSVGALAQSGRVQPTVTPTPDDTERVLIEEIKLNVLAFDENGNFFKDVAPADLVITENNILHQPESVRRIPANVLIVMDTGGDLRAVKSLEQTRRVAAAVVEALRPGDSVAILAYANKPEIVGEWTTDKGEALAAIRRTNFGIRSAFVDALKMGTDLMTHEPLDNRHIVLITDGTDSQGRASAKTEAFKRLMMTDISVHVLSYGSLELAELEPRTKTFSNTPPRPAMPEEVANQLPNGARDMAKAPKVGPTINLDRKMLQTLRSRLADLENSEHQLEGLAENTNGEFIVPGSVDEMADKAALVARMIDSSYVVTYTPKIPVSAGHGVAERNILVTSKREGLVVQARRKLLVDRR